MWQWWQGGGDYRMSTDIGKGTTTFWTLLERGGGSTTANLFIKVRYGHVFSGGEGDGTVGQNQG